MLKIQTFDIKIQIFWLLQKSNNLDAPDTISFKASICWSWVPAGHSGWDRPRLKTQEPPSRKEAPLVPVSAVPRGQLSQGPRHTHVQHSTHPVGTNWVSGPSPLSRTFFQPTLPFGSLSIPQGQFIDHFLHTAFVYPNTQI